METPELSSPPDEHPLRTSAKAEIALSTANFLRFIYFLSTDDRQY
jgi:hypothetical protein